MTLEEAIRHCEEVAELNEHIATTFPEDGPPVSPGGGSEVPEALLEPGVGAGLTGSPW